LWARDSPDVPTGSNPYSVFPIYFKYHTTGTYGVFLLNLNGMDIKLQTEDDKTTLEYNIISGILHLAQLISHINMQKLLVFQ
jgi:alpha-glucosidase